MTPGMVTVSDYLQLQICLYTKPDNSIQELSKATNQSQCLIMRSHSAFPFPHGYLMDSGKLSNKQTEVRINDAPQI